MSSDYEQFNQKSWWGPVWRGLVADPTAKHYRCMRSSLWLFLYLVVHADRKTGQVHRRYDTISRETGVSKRTLRQWLSTLEKSGYVKVGRGGRSPALLIRVQRWRALTARRKESGEC